MRTRHLTSSFILLAAAAFGLAAPATAADAPIRVAVMDFTNAAPKGELDSLGKGLQSMITTDLAESAAFKLVERDRLKDVQAELKLQKRAEIDKATAVKIGKLAGATHLVSGSFTVVGEKMRIDCRMVSVASGEVLLAEKVDGEKAAFFDLEKTLMNKLVAAAGAHVEPKERARMAKIHTADFDAFKKFSDGIGYFDEKRYDDATRALREATEIDAEFKLAHVTLAGYEELVRKARAGADAAKQSEDELERLKRDKETKLGVDLAERLQAIAKKGSTKIDRQLATSMLAMTYSGEVWGPLKMLSERSDGFYMARAADNYFKSYWASAGDLVPQLPPMPWSGHLHLPEALDKFDADFAQSRQDVEHNAESQITDINYLHTGRYFARHLQLDQRQEVEMLERLYRLGLKYKPSLEWKVKAQIELASEYQRLLELDRSTAFLVQTQKMAKSSEELRKVAEMLEVNRELERLLGEIKMKAELREYLHDNLGPYSTVSTIEDARKLFAGATELNYRISERLNAYRSWPQYEDEYVIIGEEPVWRLAGHRSGGEMRTGPRIDRIRSDEIRYWAHPSPKRRPPEETVCALGAAPLDRFSASFTLSGDPPLDWQLAEKTSYEEWQKAPPERQRPEIGLAFGLRNIGVASRGKEAPGPFSGYAVRIGSGSVRLVKLTGGKKFDPPELETITEWKVDLGAEKKVPVTVTVDDKSVKVTVSGKQFTAPAPANHGGFLGLSLGNTGYGSLTALRIKRQ